MIHQLMLIIFIVIALLTSFHFYTKIYRPLRLHYLEKKFSGLDELDLCPKRIKSFRQKDGTYITKIVGHSFPEVKRYPWGVDIKFKTALADKACIEKKLSGISNALNIPFEEVHEIGHQHFQLFRDLLPVHVRFMRNIPLHSIQIGADNLANDILINTLKYFSVFIGGSTGDGKTSLILSLIKSWLTSVSNDADIIVFDSKGLDWNNLKHNPRVKLYELNTIETLREADQCLKNFLTEFHASKKIMSAHNLIHYEDVRQKGIDLPLKRKILILDEAGRYLNPEESSSKEEKELKQSLVNSITAILAQCRVAGCPVIVSTQRVQADEMAVPYDNFQTQIFGRISKEMDTKYRSGKFFDKKLGQGIWTIKTPELDVTRVRTIYHPNAFPAPEPEIPIDPYWHFKEGPTRALILENAYYLHEGVTDKLEEAQQFFTSFSDEEFEKVLSFLKARLGTNNNQPDIVAGIRSKPINQVISFKILSISDPTSSKYVSSHKVVRIQVIATGEIQDLLTPINRVDDATFIESKIRR